MARLPRVYVAGVAQHVIQRGNNRQVCFAGEQDIKAYANWLKEYATKFSVSIHAWVFMTNHVHLLCTPADAVGISRMMQGLGRQYVKYFNYAYRRTGTLWEGRYRASLVQDEDYLLALYRYIELNPVRAKMVAEPSEYSWSSYRINALGVKSELCSPHKVYLALGDTRFERATHYRALFKNELNAEVIDDVRLSTNRGLAIGNEKFKSQIEALTGRKQTLEKRGRPVGWKKSGS